MNALAGYTRVSSIGKRKPENVISHVDQRKRIADFATSRGLNVEFLPEESDVSGGKVDRPVLAQALDGIEQGRYAGIIVAQLDRLSRMRLVDALGTIRRVEQAGGQVIAVAENFDASTRHGIYARNNFLSMAEMQLGLYADQFERAKAQAVERGIWPISRVPMGYRKGPDRHLIPDARTRKKVERAFEARAAGEPWSAVAATLGVGLSAAGKIVRNPVYLGRIVYGDWTNPAAHEPLVSRELWEAAQQSYPRPARRPGGERALLVGRVRCAGCGGALTPNSSRKHGHLERIYRCTPHNKAGGRCGEPAIISQAKLDAYVEALTLEEIARLSASAQERSGALEDARRELQAAEAELAAYEAVTRITEVGTDAFLAGRRGRQEAVQHAGDRLAHARAAAGPIPDATTLMKLWPGMGVEERGHVLRGALGVVWVRKGRGPASDRVRVVEPGFEPPGLNGRRRLDLAPLAWDDDLPGEIRPASP